MLHVFYFIKSCILKSKHYQGCQGDKMFDNSVNSTGSDLVVVGFERGEHFIETRV